MCNASAPSTASNDCNAGYHHKKWDLFDDNLPTSSLYFPILFTGHRSCGIDDLTGAHETANVAGYAPGNRIVIFPQSLIDDKNNLGALTVLHEILHLFSVADDQNDYTNTSEEYKMYCVIGKKMYDSNIQQNLTICSHCMEIVNLNKCSLYKTGLYRTYGLYYGNR